MYVTKIEYASICESILFIEETKKKIIDPKLNIDGSTATEAEIIKKYKEVAEGVNLTLTGLRKLKAKYEKEKKIKPA